MAKIVKKVNIKKSCCFLAVTRIINLSEPEKEMQFTRGGTQKINGAMLC